MKKQLEQPFEYLRRKDGTAFSPETIKHWYEARAYVLDKLNDATNSPGKGEHLHVVVTSDSPSMLSALRQTALTAHYPSFDETKALNKTAITLVSKNKAILDELKKEEYLCNLIDHIQQPFIDIDLKVVEEWHEEGSSKTIILSDDDLAAFLSTKKTDEIHCVDTRKTVLANRIYSLGTVIENLPDEDIHDTQRYAMALDVFHKLLRKDVQPLIDAKRWESDLTAVKNGFSSIATSDCFGLRARYLEDDCIEALSKSEHARWVTEKLIMGFRPLNKEERIHDERLFGNEKKQYRKQLKNNPSDPVHVDLCSYADLRRINPEDLKYDSFLMLAIPKILEKANS